MCMMGTKGFPSAAEPCLPLSAPSSHQHQHTKCWPRCSELWAHQAVWEARGARTGARTRVPAHGGHGTAAQLVFGPGTNMLQSSINDLHLPARRVAQDLFHHLEKSIYCQ